MYKRILIPLDGSERAEAIVTHLGPLLDQTGAELTLLSVVDQPDGVANPELIMQARLRARDYLDNVTSRLKSDEVLTARVAIGDPANEILRVADELQSDLIAMASHGFGGVARLVFGSTAERVLRASNTAVLVVKSFARGAVGPETVSALPLEPLHFSRILVTLDGSGNAEKVLPDAVSVAKRTGAELHLMRVRPGFPATPFYAPTPEMLGDTSAEETYLSNMATWLREDGLSVTTAVRVGSVPEHVSHYMEQHQIDMLTMTTHGRTGLDRWLLGSVAEELLRRSTVPLLLRRATEDPGLSAT